jgi:hypothetical protein
VEIDIHQADLMASFCQAEGQIDSDGGFTDSALAAHDQDFIFDSAQGFSNGNILLRQAGIARATTALLIAPAGTST